MTSFQRGTGSDRPASAMHQVAGPDDDEDDKRYCGGPTEEDDDGEGN